MDKLRALWSLANACESSRTLVGTKQQCIIILKCAIRNLRSKVSSRSGNSCSTSTSNLVLLQSDFSLATRPSCTCVLLYTESVVFQVMFFYLSLPNLYLAVPQWWRLPSTQSAPRGTDIMWISKCTGSLVNTKECLPSRTCPGKQNSRISIIELRSPGFRPMLTIGEADILRLQKRSWCLPTLGIVSLL